MNTKRTYIALCVLGFVAPYYFLARFVAENGLHLSVLIAQLFANPLMSFFAADVIVSSLVLWVFIYYETRNRSIKLWWVCIITNLVVGVSLALPLFLLFRQIQREQQARDGG